MKNLAPYCRTLGAELRRALRGASFWVAVLAVFLWMNANTIDIWNATPKEYINVLFDLPVALFNNNLFRAMLLPIATLPFAWSYIQDRESGFHAQAIARVGRRAYVFGKSLSAAVTAFLAVLLGGILFVLGFYALGSSTYPPHPIRGFVNYWEIGMEAGIIPYILVWLSIAGSAAALAAVFSLMASAWLPNRFVALLAPLIGCYTWEILNYLGYVMLAGTPVPDSILALTAPNLIVSGQIIPDRPWISLLWTCGFLLALCLPCTALFGRKVRKELGA